MASLTTVYRNHSETDSSYQDLMGNILPPFEDLGWDAPEGYAFYQYNSSRDGSGTAYNVGDAASSAVYCQYAIAMECISTVTSIDGTQYEIKDAYARSQISDISNKLVEWCFARVSSNKTNTAGATSSPTLAITSQTGNHVWTRADSNTSLVCPVNGDFEVSGAITWNPSSSGTWLVKFVMGIGGTDYTAYATSTGGTRVTAVISPTIVSLWSGNKIDIRVTATGAGTIQSGVTLSRICIRRLK